MAIVTGKIFKLLGRKYFCTSCEELFDRYAACRHTQVECSPEGKYVQPTQGGKSLAAGA